MIDVKINHQAYNRMVNTLIMLVNRIKDMRPIWKDFALWYPSEIVGGAFESRGKEFGTRWHEYTLTSGAKGMRKMSSSDLKRESRRFGIDVSSGHKRVSAYWEWKQKHYPGKPMLVLSGAMKDAAMHPSVKYDNFNMRMTVENDLANIHQFGADLKQGKIPARPFFAMPDKTMPRRAVKYLMENMKKYIMGDKK